MRLTFWLALIGLALLAVNYARYDTYYGSTARHGEEVMATGYALMADAAIGFPFIFLCIVVARRLFPARPMKQIMQIALPLAACWPTFVVALMLAIEPY